MSILIDLADRAAKREPENQVKIARELVRSGELSKLYHAQTDEVCDLELAEAARRVIEEFK